MSVAVGPWAITSAAWGAALGGCVIHTFAPGFHPSVDLNPCIPLLVNSLGGCPCDTFGVERGSTNNCPTRSPDSTVSTVSLPLYNINFRFSW